MQTKPRDDEKNSSVDAVAAAVHDRIGFVERVIKQRVRQRRRIITVSVRVVRGCCCQIGKQKHCCFENLQYPQKMQ